MGLIIEVKKPPIPAGFTVIQKDILGHLGHLFSISTHKEKENHIYKDREESVPSVPDDEDGEEFPFSDDEI